MNCSADIAFVPLSQDEKDYLVGYQNYFRSLIADGGQPMYPVGNIMADFSVNLFYFLTG